MKKAALTESVEMYLKTIHAIIEGKQVARSKEIASLMNVNTSSVTSALRSLSESGLINYKPYDVITLTPLGEELAHDILHRHAALQNFFIEVLGLDPEEASDAACRIEHVVSRSTLDRIVAFAAFYGNNEAGKLCKGAFAQWLAGQAIK